MRKAGIVAMGAFVPGQPLAERYQRLAAFLESHTRLPLEHVAPIAEGKLPGRVETNQQGWADQPWFAEWLARLPEKKQRDPFGGARERRRVPLDPRSVRSAIVPHPMLSSDAETLAGALALFAGEIDPLSVDQLLVNSLVPNRPLPSNAPLVQHKLGLARAGAYYVDTCCASFVTMLELAMTYVRAGMRERVLLVASSIDSHINDRSTYYSPNTGDAAVAAVVAAVEEDAGFLGSASATDGSRHAAIIFDRRPPELHVSAPSAASHAQDFVTFNDLALCKRVAETAGKEMAAVVGRALEQAGLGVPEIDFMVTHQPVAWAAQCWRDAVGVAPERFHESFERYGNVACASAGINLWEALHLGKVKAGDRVLCCSSGAGEHWMALLHRVAAALPAATYP